MNDSSLSKFQRVVIIVVRIMLAYLFFSQLFWKFPPSFGCSPDFNFTTGTLEDGRIRLQRTSGLCDWIGVEAFYSHQPRPFFVADMTPIGGPALSINLGWLARLNGIIIENLIQPNIQWIGWLLWLAEAFIFASLLFGLFSRLGGLVALGVSAQLAIGLAGIPNPYEWEWAYLQMVLLSLVVLAFVPGRYFGIDAWLRPRITERLESGSRVAGLLLWLT